MSPLKSQVFGLVLGLTTAIGCIFYEKLVSKLSYMTVAMTILCEYLFFGLLFGIAWRSDLAADAQVFSKEPKLWWWAGIYILTGITSPLWYYITKRQGVMVSSLYEVKYIVMLAVLYILFGNHRLGWSTGAGIVLAAGSIYCISHQK